MRWWSEGKYVTMVQNGLVQGIVIPIALVESVECIGEVFE
jgi:hypothetical protein